MGKMNEHYLQLPFSSLQGPSSLRSRYTRLGELPMVILLSWSRGGLVNDIVHYSVRYGVV